MSKDLIGGHQIPLAAGFDAFVETMDSFCVFDGNKVPFNFIKSLTGINIDKESRFLYLYGPHASGKTHLLRSVIMNTEKHGISTVAYDMDNLSRFSPDSMMTGLEDYKVIGLDNVDSVAGNPDWEAEIFNLYNRWLNKGSGIFFVVCHNIPTECGFVKPDLVTRLQSGVSLSISPVPEQIIPELLVKREKIRGGILALDKAVMLARYLPDLDSCLWALDELDKATLENKSGFTRALIKQVLEKYHKKEESLHNPFA